MKKKKWLILLLLIPFLVSAGGGMVIFNDELWKLYDNSDTTKRLRFQVSPITTGTTRTITMANRDLNLSTPVFDSLNTHTIPGGTGTLALTSDLGGYLPLSALSDTAYGAGWNGDTSHAASKNAIYDKIETLGGAGATTALDNLASVAINASLVLGTTDAFALGSTTKQWSDLFLAEGGVINWDNGDVTLTQTGNELALAGGDLSLGANGLTTTGLITTGTFKIDGDSNWTFTPSINVTETPDWDILTARNNTDNDMHFTLQAGSTTNARAYLRWNDYTGTIKWVLGRNAVNQFILYDSSVGNHCIRAQSNSSLDLSAASTEAVKINYYPAAITGTGGLEVYSGGASPALWTQIKDGYVYTLAGFDAIGAVDMDYGSADVTDHTFVSDGGTVIIDGDLFLSEGGVINWDSGDMTITQTGNELVVAGGDVNVGNLIASGLLLNYSIQDFLVTSRGGAALAVQGQQSGQTSELELYTADGDGTDDISITLFSMGSPTDLTNYESLKVGFDQSESYWQIYSGESGTGTLYPIHLWTKGNASQLVLNTNGTVSSSGSLTATGSFIIGSADMSEVDLEKFDGITDGTAAANKALVLGASGEIATITSATITTATITNNIKATPRHLIFTIVDPLAVQTEDNEVCLWPVTPAALTITKIVVTLNAADNEVAGDLKWADAFIGLANATVINAFDTTSGVLSDDTITAGAVAAGKCIYISFDSAPNTAITQMSVDITYDYD